MIRETLDAGARNAIIFVTPGQGLAFQWRDTADGATTALSAEVATADLMTPVWIRLTRKGDELSVRVEIQLFNCAACHRNEGAGGEALTQVLGGEAAAKWRTPPDLTGVAARLRGDSLFTYLHDGARKPLR